jgi:hypothetical protein
VFQREGVHLALLVSRIDEHNGPPWQQTHTFDRL